MGDATLRTNRTTSDGADNAADPRYGIEFLMQYAVERGVTLVGKIVESTMTAGADDQ